MRGLFTFVLLAILAIKTAGVLARGPVSIERDAFGYWRLSALAMSGDVLMLGEPIAYRTPAYPWFLAVIRQLAGAHALMVTVMVQGVLSVCALVIGGHIAARITKLPQAMPWTLAVSLPAVSALTFSAAVLSESLFVFLFMLNLLAVMDYAKYDTGGRAMWVGITFAVTLLTRPIVLLIWIPHIIFVLLIHIRRRRRLGKDAPGRVRLRHRLAHLAMAALVTGILILPWLSRNQSLFGKPMLTEFVGRNLWVVTFQDGSGAGLTLPPTDAGDRLRRRLARVSAPDDTWRQTWSVSNALVASGLNDAQADQLMKQVAIDAIKTDQQTFAYKAFRRIVNFWRCAATELPQQNPAGGEFRGQATWKLAVPPIDWAIEHRWSGSVALNTLLTVVVGVAILYLIVNPPTRPYAIWLALMFAYFSAVTGVLEIPAYRYRLVVEPLVATAIGSAIAVTRSHRRKPVTVVSAS